ncbi:hypothetical protein CesoFtcFv8_024554 [Champsocephalus esox]|nr:hypothetical protein CesoFtcFv8_024554 [Champsocephalus esox]
MIIHIASAGTLLVDPPHWHLQMQWPKHHRVQHLMCQCLKKMLPALGRAFQGLSLLRGTTALLKMTLYRMTAKTARMMENIQWMAEKIQCQTKNIWYPMHN